MSSPCPHRVQLSRSPQYHSILINVQIKAHGGNFRPQKWLFYWEASCAWPQTQCKRQVTPQSFQEVLMVLAASESERIIIFITILYPAFVQDKEMLLPSFFFRWGIEVDSHRSFRYHRCLLALCWSSGTPCKHPSFTPGKVTSGARS